MTKDTKRANLRRRYVTREARKAAAGLDVLLRGAKMDAAGRVEFLTGFLVGFGERMLNDVTPAMLDGMSGAAETRTTLDIVTLYDDDKIAADQQWRKA